MVCGLVSGKVGRKVFRQGEANTRSRLGLKGENKDVIVWLGIKSSDPLIGDNAKAKLSHLRGSRNCHQAKLSQI